MASTVVLTRSWVIHPFHAAVLGGVLPLFLGALLIGLGNGPTVPAGSRILARTVPPAHRRARSPSGSPARGS